jgi:MFS family permease
MQMRLLVAGVWLYEETGSGLQLGLLGVVQLAVQLPGILFGGALADQLDRKKLIAFTQSFSFVFLVILTLLMATGNLKPWHIYAVTAILGISASWDSRPVQPSQPTSCLEPTCCTRSRPTQRPSR